MASDRPDEGDADGPGEARPEALRHRGSDASATKPEVAETRSHAEYYEALRAADGRHKPVADGGREQADGRTEQVDSRDRNADIRIERSGWDTVDPGKRPSLDALRVTPERSAHILDGDATGGGHRHGTGRPGKTEFPASWDDEKVSNALLDVARRPDQQPGHQKWNDRWVARGTRDDVEIVVVIAGDGRIWSGWPNPGSSGVIKNPEET